MIDDLGALLDVAVDAVLAAAEQITGIGLPSSVTFVFDGHGDDRPRRVDHAEALALVAATRTGDLFARVAVSVLGIHDGRSVIQLRETPMAASASDVFRPGGVNLGRARFRDDGTIDWSLPITRAELEANGREAVEASATD